MNSEIAERLAGEWRKDVQYVRDNYDSLKTMFGGNYIAIHPTRGVVDNYTDKEKLEVRVAENFAEDLFVILVHTVDEFTNLRRLFRA